MSFHVGDQVGDYRIVGSVGAGGVGEVFRVEHNITGRVEAMKVLLQGRADSAVPAERFQREIKLQAKLDHPNIASVHNAFWAADELVMVMELVEGLSLDHSISEGPLKTGAALRYSMQCLLALEYAHEQGITHRDIKPENVMITPDGRVKLMDFGLAKEHNDPKLTQVGAVVGSLYYISPEQARGKEEFDHRTDIYSFGAVLYELLTGQRPFAYNNSFELLQAAVGEAPRPPIELRPDLPMGLNNAVLRAMAKDPNDRFVSAREFRMALEAVSINPAAAVAPPPKPGAAGREALTSAQKAQRLRRLVFVACGLMAVVYLSFSALSKTRVAEEVRNYQEGGEGSGVQSAAPTAAPLGYAPQQTISLGQTAWALAFTADGQRLAAAAADATLKIIHATEGSVEASLEGHASQVVDVDFSPDGALAASASWDQTARVWDLRRSASRALFSHSEKVTSVAFSRDGRLLATGSADDSIRIWDLENPNSSASLKGPDSGPSAMAFSPTGALLAAVSDETSVRFWALREKSTEQLEGLERGASNLDFSSNGLELAAAGGNRVTVWDVATRSLRESFEIPGWLYDLEYNQQLGWLVLAVPGTEPNVARLWVLSESRLLMELPHSSPVKAVTIGQGGGLLATASEGGTVAIWSAQTPR